ncbi:MAG: T9SS type A sorting domain-containing protein [Bacteroidota bacterium]|nr:T9SS type A sorting domain-containing protein [Bacteroidota bacterium]
METTNPNARNGKSPYSGPPFAHFAGTVQYYYISDDGQIAAHDLHNYQTQIKAAFDTWSNAGYVKFSQSQTANGVKLSASPSQSYDASTLCVINNQYEIDANSEDIDLSNRFIWTNGTHDLDNNNFDVQTIFTHEVGHVMGLFHPMENTYPNDQTAPIMAGADCSWKKTHVAYDLKPEDIAGLQFTQTWVPNLCPTISEGVATANSIGIGWVFVNGNISLDQDITLNGGTRLVVKAGKYLDLNNHVITLNGGEIIIESGATTNGIYIKNGSTQVKMCPSIQSAVNTASEGQTVELLNKTYNETFNITNKTNIVIKGQGNGTVLNGNINSTLSTGCTLQNFKLVPGYRISATSGNITLNNVNTDANTNTAISIYNCNNFDISNWSSIATLNETINPCFTVNTSGGGHLSYSTIKNQEMAISVDGGASFYADNNTFCSNGGDVYVYRGLAVLTDNTFSYTKEQANQEIGGMIIYKGTSSTCDGLPKVRSNAEAYNQNIEPGYKECISIDSTFNKLLKKNEYKNLSINRGNEDYYSIIGQYKDILNKYTESAFTRFLPSRISKCYLLLNDLEGLKAYVDEALNNNKYAKIKNYIERNLIDYYLNRNEIDNAFSIADQIISSSKDDIKLRNEILYEKGTMYKYLMNNANEADKYFAMILNSKFDTGMMDLAKYQLSDKNLFKVNYKEEENGDNALEVSSYPNPFNPITKVTFSLPEASFVSVKVFNQIGQEVANLGDKIFKAGKNEVDFDGSNLASGIYIVTIKAGVTVKSHKLILMK